MAALASPQRLRPLPSLIHTRATIFSLVAGSMNKLFSVALVGRSNTRCISVRRPAEVVWAVRVRASAAANGSCSRSRRSSVRSRSRRPVNSTFTMEANPAHVLLQPSQRRLGTNQLASEGEIILSSSGSELGCFSIIHAGGAGGAGHSGGRTVSRDAQPTFTSSNSSSKPSSFSSGVGERLGVALIEFSGISGKLTLHPQRVAQAVHPGCCHIELAGYRGNRRCLTVDLPPEQAHDQHQYRYHAEQESSHCAAPPGTVRARLHGGAPVREAPGHRHTPIGSAHYMRRPGHPLSLCAAVWTTGKPRRLRCRRNCPERRG